MSSIHSNPLRRIAAEMGWIGSGDSAWSYERLLNEAENAYWRNRPAIGSACGTRDGINAHRRRGEKNCPNCLRVQAQLRAISRARTAA